MSLRLDWIVLSYSLERMRNFPSQLLVRSTTQRLGRSTNPFMSSVRFTSSISSDVVRRISSMTCPVYAPSAQTFDRVGYSACAVLRTSGAPSRSCTEAGVTTATRSKPRTSTRRCRLRPFTFFSRVEAAWATDVCRLDALAVEDRRRRLGVTSLGDSNATAKAVVEGVEHTSLRPLLVPLEDCRPGRQIVWQRSPRHARPRAVANRVEQFARRVARLLEVFKPNRRRNLRLHQSPLFVAQIAGVNPAPTGLGLHEVPLSTHGSRWKELLWNTF